MRAIQDIIQPEELFQQDFHFLPSQQVSGFYGRLAGYGFQGFFHELCSVDLPVFLVRHQVNQVLYQVPVIAPPEK